MLLREKREKEILRLTRDFGMRWGSTSFLVVCTILSTAAPYRLCSSYPATLKKSKRCKRNKTSQYETVNCRENQARHACYRKGRALSVQSLFDKVVLYPLAFRKTAIIETFAQTRKPFNENDSCLWRRNVASGRHSTRSAYELPLASLAVFLRTPVLNALIACG